MRSNLTYLLVPFLAVLMMLSFGITVQAKEWRLRSGDVMSDVSPYGEGMLKFAELVKERSKGKIVIKHFPSAQLGKDNAIIDGVRMGSIDMAATGGLGSKVISGFAAPFLFNDHVHMDRFFASSVWKDIKSAYQKETGIHIIGGAYFPPRMMTTKNTEIVNPGDCKGLKIRVPPVPPLVNTWKALGASPTPIAFAELFTALQQGTVDAQENPLQIIYDQSYFEVQKYVAPIRYLTPPRFLIINKELWDDLGEKNQAIMQRSWEDAAHLIQRRYVEKEQWWEDQLKAKGMIFTKPNIDAFRKATADVGKAIATNAWGADTYEKIIALGKMHGTD